MQSEDRPERPEQGSAAERDRILAAVGWETDPRRRRILRELLREHVGRIYLYSFAGGRGRNGSVDRSRVALLQTARSLEQVPDGCSLSVWIYLGLREEPLESRDCPEPWRLLAAAEQSGAGDPAASAAPVHAAERERIDRHLEAHVSCRALLEDYRRYLTLPQDSELRDRAGLRLVAHDLERFLNAQFGDEHPQAVTGRSNWRQSLPSSRWLRSRMTGGAVAVVAVVLVVFFFRAWQPGGTRWSTNPPTGSPVTAAEVPQPPPGPAPVRIESASCVPEGDKLTFRWTRVMGVSRYRVQILTAKLEPIYESEELTAPGLRVPIAKIGSITSGGSYLYRVDGLKAGRTIASTGPTPFTAP